MLRKINCEILKPFSVVYFDLSTRSAAITNGTTFITHNVQYRKYLY